ncbi:hypothetical protein BJ742DRAFT_788554 [Cladochytrium replicatum]|nr:hypothetical protein BJ742DRAFT_788554 [Cladochytrium replicatum]
MDVISLVLCILPFGIPSIALVTRAFELIAVHLVLLHILASLWFLESFKEVVLAPRPGRGGLYFSSVTVEAAVQLGSNEMQSGPISDRSRGQVFEQRQQQQQQEYDLYGATVSANGSIRTGVGGSGGIGGGVKREPGPSPYSPYGQAELYGTNGDARSLSIGREFNVDPGPSPYSPFAHQIQTGAGRQH